MSYLGLDPQALPLLGWIAVVGVLSACSCATLGVYLVLRRLSLLGDAISHAVLPGIVIAFLLAGRIHYGLMFLGALGCGLLTAWLTGALQQSSHVTEDSSMGIVFTSMFALGVVLLSRFSATVDLDPGCVLYGLIESAPFFRVQLGPWELPRSVVSLGAVALAVLGFVLLFWKELKLAAFDAGLAASIGLRPRLLHYLLMAMVALVTVASFEAVGSILVVAMFIMPAVTAHLLCDRLWAMMLVANLLAALAAVIGVLAAVWLGTSTAGMITVVSGILFLMAVIAAPRQGLMAKLVGNFGLALRIHGEDVLAFLVRAEERAGQQTAESRAGSALASLDALRLAGGGLMGRLAMVALRLRGLIQAAGDRATPGWMLTPPGRQLGTSLVRAHRLWESYLVEHFALPLDHLHQPAERLEHFLGPRLQEELARELARPGIDPHGKPIPPPAAPSHPG